jgi:hypothetical protein
LRELDLEPVTERAGRVTGLLEEGPDPQAAELSAHSEADESDQQDTILVGLEALGGVLE